MPRAEVAVGRQADAIGERIRKRLETIFKALVLEIDKELRRSTPVDTGHARANWVPSVGAPREVAVQGGEAHAAGVAEVLSFRIGDGATGGSPPASPRSYMDRM